MGDMLRADVEALRVMAAGLRGEAAAIAAIDPVDQVAKVALAMPNSAIGSAAAGVGAPLLAVLRQMAGELTDLSEVTDHGATTYEAVAAELETRLDEYLTGTP
ncbi:hypothetical protein [Nocardia crassostreae]|uniref:hypothetical protein n=1 Tax=Nocardia crassostreae TaxID=53428 RepID=UPI0008336B60|nr:hypothetical protein [Nocardia crassostreae]